MNTKAGSVRAFGFTIAAILTGCIVTLTVLYLFLVTTVGAGIDWSDMFNYNNSIFGMGGWYLLLMVLTLVLVGAVYSVLIASRADIKMR
jgi:hypothetical protein